MMINVTDITGEPILLLKEISRGGQGAVYRTDHPNLAVKLEFDRENMEYSRDVSNNEKFNFLRLLPLPDNINITLPQVVLSDYAGYTMTLLDDMESFESAFAYDFNFETDYTNDWLESIKECNETCANDFAQYIVTGGLRRRLEAYYKCAMVLSILHSVGLVYCDLSSNNIFVSKDGTKAVWLIDADNINFQSYTAKNGGYYTPGYAAPEIIKGKGSTFYSDCYSFAISFFWNMTWIHPFMGVMTEEGIDDDFADDSQDKAYSGEYPWILDKEDDGNCLGEDASGMPIDMIVSHKLMKYFDRTFSSKGKDRRHTRTTMFEWTNVIAEAMDSVLRCPVCGMDYNGNGSNECPWCENRPVVIELITKINDNDFWMYRHEIIENKVIAIPLRVIEGVKSANVDRNAFYLKKEEKGYIISDFVEDYDFQLETEDKGKVSIYGEVVISEKCRLIVVNSRMYSEPVIIEVVIR